MNNSLAVFLINDTCRAIRAAYEATDNAKSDMFKTFDHTIKVGDYVVVPTATRHHMTVFKVTEVDVDVDFDSTKEVSWVVCRVDTSQNEMILERENDALTKIRQADIRQRRAALRESLLANAGDTLLSTDLAAIGVDKTTEQQ